MDPWVLFALVQQTKAHADLHRFDEAQACIDAAVEGLERFPILASHVYEAVGQVRTIWGEASARESFEAALGSAEKSGLLARRGTLLRYVSRAE